MFGSLVLGGVVLLMLLVFYLHYRSMEEKRKLCAKMNKLWVDHIVYTRQVMVSTLDRATSSWGVKNRGAYLSRLMQNQGDIASMFGSDKESVQKLLEEHIKFAGDFMTSVANTGTGSLDPLYLNASDIGAYLNSRLVRTDMKDHMKAHISSLAAMIMDYYNMKDSEVASLDSYISATMGLSDILCTMFI